MKIYSIICTRSKNLNAVTQKLTSKLSSLPSKVILMTNQKSIFSGYKNAFDKIDPADNDIFILCHDDIEINETPEDIVKGISIVNAEGYGFAGVAGTKLLGADAARNAASVPRMSVFVVVVPIVDADLLEPVPS